MPITASCGNCGKTYQAPDRMAGKSVRCKACGEIFRIDSADAGELDLDALEASVSGEPLATHHATALGGAAMGGPEVDEYGRARIERPDEVEAFSVAAAHAPGFRSNFRFRYPGAKLVDQFLPIAIVLLTLLLLTQACMNNEANLGEPPPTAIAVSRLIILLAAYLVVVWPASYIALRMASTKMRFSMPSAAGWRSFAGCMPVLLMGGWLFVKSGGSGVALAMGLLVGVALAVGAVALLFRVFANEVPTVAGYVAVGALGSSIFAALAIIAINMIAVSIAGMDKNPTVFVSPIAIGLPWIDKPAVPVTVAVKPATTKLSTTKPAPGPTATITAPGPSRDAPVADAPLTITAPVPPGATPSQPNAAPQTLTTTSPLLKSLERAPVASGFDEIVVPPIESTVMAVIRNAAGGSVEVWDRTNWRRPSAQIGQGFDRAAGALVVDPAGKKIIRLVRFPTDRLEQVPLGNAAAMSPVTMIGEAVNRTLLGFVNEKEVLIRSGTADQVSFERYDIAGAQRMPLTPLRNTTSGRTEPMDVALTPRTVRTLPDGNSLLVAGRDRSAKDSPARLALYALPNLDKAEAFRDIPLKADYEFRPLGLAVRPSGRAALLLDFGGEASLSVYELRDSTVEGAVVKARSKAVIEQRYGVLHALRPPYWDDAIDPLLWIDEETLLLYGNLLVDARTGTRLGTLNVPEVTGHFPVADGSFLLVTMSYRSNSLLKATLDPAALVEARKPRE